MKNTPRLYSRQITLNCSIKGLKKTILFLFQSLLIFPFFFPFFIHSFSLFCCFLDMASGFFSLEQLLATFYVNSIHQSGKKKKKHQVRATPFSECSQTQIYPNEKVKKKIELFSDKDRNKDKVYMKKCRVIQGQSNQKVKIVFI